MSDFDKEAERQKLREKFDRDKEKRKETERMSQLLLQGATMTNRHCDTCGDPLFRYQGQTFCATCEGRAQEAATADAESDTDVAAANAPAGEDADVAGDRSPDLDADRAADAAAEGDTRAVESDAAGHPAPTTDGRPAPSDAASAVDEHRAAGSSPATTSKQAASGSARSNIGGSTGGSDGAGGLGAARASLIRTLTHHAQRAEAVDDPRRATDHLTAVREAAEALAAVDRSR